MINNSIRNWQGNTVGFKCSQCGGIYQSMWGDVCNGCRKSNENNEKLIAEIRDLKNKLNQKQ